jgi:hypothetical protein
MPGKPYRESLVLKKILFTGIAFVWLINGLFFKLLNLVPRHQLIVSRILGEKHAFIFTKMIGGLEVFMFAWIISRIKPRLCAAIQIMTVTAMNIIEFILVPDLLLFGKINSLLALLFIFIIFYTWYMPPVYPVSRNTDN